MKNYYKKHKPLLYLAVANAFINTSSYTILEDWQYECVQDIENAYSSEIWAAKDIINRSPNYRNLPINEKAELATWITEYLYSQKLEENNTEIKYRYLV